MRWCTAFCRAIAISGKTTVTPDNPLHAAHIGNQALIHTGSKYLTIIRWRVIISGSLRTAWQTRMLRKLFVDEFPGKSLFCLRNAI